MRDASHLSSRNVIGQLLAVLNGTRFWWAGIVDRVETNQLNGEDFGLLGGPGQMKETNGSTEAKEPKVYDWFVKNRFFELAARIPNRTFRHSSQSLLTRWINSHASVAGRHPGVLLKDLINAAETNVCYDEVAYFNGSHPITGGTQSNLLSKTVGSLTGVTDKEMTDAVMAAIARIYSLTDDQGNAINEDVNNFTICASEGMWLFLQPALRKLLLAGGGSNPVGPGQQMNLNGDGYEFGCQVKLVPGMTANLFDVYAAGVPDGGPFIYQTLEELDTAFLGLESEYSKAEGHVLAKVEVAHNMAYGRYQRAVRQKLSV